jgi:hypothetical protein
MKNLTILILLCIPLLGSSQNTKQPKYYLNLEDYNMDSVFLYLNNIDSLYVKKDIPGGEIFIRTKSQPWEYNTLEELLERTPLYSQIIDKSIIPIYIIDGKVINKMSDAKIDKSYFAKVTLGRLSKVQGMSGKNRKLVIVNVVLTDKDPKKDVYIRGDSLLKTGT